LQQSILPLLSAGCEVVLLGDAEYDTTEIIVWIEKHPSWSYVLRTSPQIYVFEGQNSQPIGDYPLAKGQMFQRSQVGFTQSAVVLLNLVGWWSSRYEDPLYLVTNISNGTKPANTIGVVSKLKLFSLTRKAGAFTSTKAICQTHCA